MTKRTFFLAAGVLILTAATFALSVEPSYGRSVGWSSSPQLAMPPLLEPGFKMFPTPRGLDARADGRSFRCFNIVDDMTRECPAIEVVHSLPALRIIQVLDRLARTRGLPKSIVCNNGPEFAGHALNVWAHDRGVSLQFIRPGKPVENAFIESFNGTFRNECLDVEWFTSITDAQQAVERWRVEYNEVRPHSRPWSSNTRRVCNGSQEEQQFTPTTHSLSDSALGRTSPIHFVPTRIEVTVSGASGLSVHQADDLTLLEVMSYSKKVLSEAKAD